MSNATSVDVKRYICGCQTLQTLDAKRYKLQLFTTPMDAKRYKCHRW